MKRTFAYFSSLSLALLLAMTPVTTSNLFAQDKADQEEEKQSVDDLMSEARSLMDQGNYEAAAKVFQKVVDQDPKNGQAWHLLGYSLHIEGNLDDALKAHTKASQSDDGQSKFLGFYNMACVYSLKEQADKAFECLNKSVDAGFRDVGQIEDDSDLDNIRDDKRLAEIIALINNDGKRDETKKKISIAGSWKVVSGLNGGAEIEQLPPSIKITKDEIAIPSPEGTFVFSYEIDATKKPIQVDMKMEEGPQPGGIAKGIIKIDGDSATLCYHPMEGDRPEKFESTEDDQFHLFVMKKQTPKLDAETLVGDWGFVLGSRAGEEVSKERLATTIKIEKDQITIPAGEESFVMSYTIDNSKSPATIDMEILSGPAPEGSPAIGIVKMEGEHFVLCYDSTGAKRPEKFESSEEDGFFMFKLKKVVVD